MQAGYTVSLCKKLCRASPDTRTGGSVEKMRQIGPAEGETSTREPFATENAKENGHTKGIWIV